MGLVQTVFRLLRPVADSLVDVAMAEALPTADRTAKRLIVLSLLERQHEQGMRGLVAHYHLMDRGLRQLVIEHMEDMDEAIRWASRNASVDVRLNAVELVTLGRRYRMAMVLGDLTGDSDVRISRAAAAGLRELAEALATEDRGGERELVGQYHPARRAQWLASALSEGCSKYAQHGRRDVLLAALAMAPRKHPEVIKHMAGAGPSATVMRELIRSGDEPAIDGAMIWCAGIDGLQTAVIDSLSRRGVDRRWGVMLKQAHLTAAPAIRATLRKVSGADHLAPEVGELNELPVETQQQAARWIAALSMEPRKRVAAYAQLTGANDPLVRLQAVRGLMVIDEVEAEDALSAMCFDSEPAISRMALRHLMYRKWHGLPGLMVRLVASPHQDVRAVAEKELAPLGFASLWTHWEKLEEPVRKTAGRALMKIDRNFHRQLAAKLASADSDDRFKAVMMVRQLGQETYFEAQLLKLTQDMHHAVASAAVKALGAITDSGKVAQTLQTALEHPNDRVRANAVESLEQIGKVDEAAPKLVKLARQSGNRSRANAIKALMQLPFAGAMTELRTMLQDTEPAHRISALWIVERMALSEVGRVVGDIARADGDFTVRRRAMRVLRQMAEQVQSSMTNVQSSKAG
jgi:HEAT repeat protein